MEDNQIIELFFQRDETALTHTRERYGSRLQALAFRILGNREDAEECENDTYWRAWNSIPPQRPQFLAAYLAKICRNLALHLLEKSNADKRTATVIELTSELSECLPDHRSQDETDEREWGERMSRFLQTVSQENRTIFIRRYFLSESVSVIAQTLHISESKVKSSLFRTRKKLRDYLSKEESL